MFKASACSLFDWSMAGLSCVVLTDQPLEIKFQAQKHDFPVKISFFNTSIATYTNHHLPSGSQVVHVKLFFCPS